MVQMLEWLDKDYNSYVKLLVDPLEKVNAWPDGDCEWRDRNYTKQN